MKAEVPTLLPILRSRAQGRLLALVLLHPGTEYTVTQVAAAVGTSVPTALREVRRAEGAGLVTTRPVGRARVVRAKSESPLYRPMSELLARTFGPPVVLAGVLTAVQGLQEAYIYGSWAARMSGLAGDPPNDVDLLLIGTPDRDRLDQAVDQAERLLGCPVHPTIRSSAQWDHAIEPFVVEMRRRPLVAIPVATERPS